MKYESDLPGILNKYPAYKCVAKIGDLLIPVKRDDALCEWAYKSRFHIGIDIDHFSFEIILFDKRVC